MTRPAPALSSAWHRLDATLADDSAPSLELLDELDTSSTGTWQPVRFFETPVPPHRADVPLPSSCTHSLVCALESRTGDRTRDLRPTKFAASYESVAARMPPPVPSQTTKQAARSAGGGVHLSDVCVVEADDARTLATAVRSLSGERLVVAAVARRQEVR